MTPIALGIILGFQAFMLLLQLLLAARQQQPSVIHVPVPFAVIPPQAKEYEVTVDSDEEPTDPGSTGLLQ